MVRTFGNPLPKPALLTVPAPIAGWMSPNVWVPSLMRTDTGGTPELPDDMFAIVVDGLKDIVEMVANWASA